MERYDTWDGQKKYKEIEESLRVQQEFSSTLKEHGSNCKRFCRTIWAGSNSMTAHASKRESPRALEGRRKSSRANESQRESPRVYEYRRKLPRNTCFLSLLIDYNPNMGFDLKTIKGNEKSKTHCKYIWPLFLIYTKVYDDGKKLPDCHSLSLYI